LNLGMALHNAMGGGIDFNEFYSAARLAGTGHLYDTDALWRLEAGHGPPIPCGRLPVVAYGMKLLTVLPYSAARALWLAASVAALLVFGALWPGADRRTMWMALAWSVPAGYLLLLGQDTPFWLMFFAGGLALLERGHPRLAGVVFALCLCKFHLAVGIPVMLASRRLWKTLAAGAITVAALVAACFPIEGLRWPRQYIALVRQPGFSVADGRMPNLRGLAWWLPGAAIIELAGATLLVLLLWRFCRRTPSLGKAGAAAAACGLLLGHHGYLNDCALLIPLAAIAVRDTPKPLWFRGWALASLTPIVALLLTSTASLAGQALCVALVFAALLLK
jgi:Glycosyltransferase family 87